MKSQNPKGGSIRVVEVLRSYPSNGYGKNAPPLTWIV